MDLEFYVRIRTCEKRVTGKQPLVSIVFAFQLFTSYHTYYCAPLFDL